MAIYSWKKSRQILKEKQPNLSNAFNSLGRRKTTSTSSISPHTDKRSMPTSNTYLSIFTAISFAIFHIYENERAKNKKKNKKGKQRKNTYKNNYNNHIKNAFQSRDIKVLTLSIRISLNAIFLTVGSSSVSRNFFIATYWPDSRCRQRITKPYEPSPTTDMMSYFSIIVNAVPFDMIWITHKMLVDWVRSTQSVMNFCGKNWLRYQYLS